jgi:hypothetical protein
MEKMWVRRVVFISMAWACFEGGVRVFSTLGEKQNFCCKDICNRLEDSGLWRYFAWTREATNVDWIVVPLG